MVDNKARVDNFQAELLERFLSRLHSNGQSHVIQDKQSQPFGTVIQTQNGISNQPYQLDQSKNLNKDIQGFTESPHDDSRTGDDNFEKNKSVLYSSFHNDTK